MTKVWGPHIDATRITALWISGAKVNADKYLAFQRKDNAEFAAKYIPHAELNVIPGRVDHEIFCNECDEEGKNAWPEACIDGPGVDRAKIHESIGNAALKFFDTSMNVPRGGQN